MCDQPVLLPCPLLLLAHEASGVTGRRVVTPEMGGWSMLSGCLVLAVVCRLQLAFAPWLRGPGQPDLGLWTIQRQRRTDVGVACRVTVYTKPFATSKGLA